ncbi:MAG: xanthan lyase, partial [Bacteroidales bacterium]|nr:xanthan lyase [Bacteroidales bacterium]
NIRYVSKYESKLLFRSWFFRIFALLSIAALVLQNIQSVLMQDMWQVVALPSNVAYASLLILNVGQAVIAIFLASDFLKRDRKLDTSEIFYVRPLGNAEYVFGKIWGNLRIFFILNLTAIVISIVFTAASRDVTIDWGAYAFYFLTISIPTLIYIIGLSVFLMLIFRNQAITFVVLLGYIGVTLFYIKGKYYYLFDYMAYYLPLMKSTIVGFPNMEEIIVHRSIYLFAGLACIFMTVSLFGRLPNSSRGSYPWIILSICAFMACAGAGYRHISRIFGQNEIRLLYTQVNNKYVHTPKMTVEQYDISVKQNPETFDSEVRMKGTALSASQVFTFCLNPGLKVEKIESEGRTLDFVRDRQIILTDFGREIPAGDTVSLSISYSGKTDNSFCYLDVPEEELNMINSMFMFNIDKQYSFQTPDYMLVTPETFWYPRPGTGYSDESPDWQQTYFSRFTLNVTPRRGLIPLSQGEGVENADGSYSFAPEYPVQAISLAIGNYRQKSIERDSVRYSIWHIEGNDYFYATALDSIRDTIPALVQNIRENMERQYRLDYPFRRFSIVEVPAQFYCHARTWSQAQETVQPEMVLFIERGCKYYQMYLPRIIENEQRWRRGQTNPKEAQINAFNWASSMFTNPVGDVNFRSNRGSYNLNLNVNRYFVFPQFYNFRYNIFSPEWTVANRMVELYLQNGMSSPSWERETNGISDSEKANILLEQRPFKDLLSDPKHRSLTNSITGQKTFQLFAVPEMNIGAGAFRDSLYSALKKYTFRNVQFESLLDTLGRISGTDILRSLASWNEPVKLPVYTVDGTEMIRVNNRGVEDFVLKVTVSNHSDYDGIIHVSLARDDPRAERKVMIPARRSLQMVSVWDSPPENMTVNTMISGNLPNIVSQPVNTDIHQENRKLSEIDADIILPEDWSPVVPDEVIVDNDDSALFVLSEKTVPGLLPKLLDDSKDKQFKYYGFWWWRPPLQWTASTNGKFHGNHIRSAYVVRSIRSKGGDQAATWKIPVPSSGQYELYYHTYVDDNMRYNRHYYKNAEYRFKVEYGKETEDAYLAITKSNGGWERLGVYYFESDTVRVTLSNECKSNNFAVVADAVKIVKR